MDGRFPGLNSYDNELEYDNEANSDMSFSISLVECEDDENNNNPCISYAEMFYSQVLFFSNLSCPSWQYRNQLRVFVWMEARAAILLLAMHMADVTWSLPPMPSSWFHLVLCFLLHARLFVSVTTETFCEVSADPWLVYSC
eukprot:scaffold318_cov332-Ochromonas_danica.AAC.2